MMLMICLSFKVSYSQKTVKENVHYLLGEHLHFDVKYSFFKVGEAELVVDSLIHHLNDKSYYRVKVEVKSVGLLKFFYSDLFLHYESYISNENNAHVLKTSRKLRHGKSVSEDYDQFIYSDSLYIENWNTKKERRRAYSYYENHENIRDVLGTFMKYRQMDLTNLNQTDTSYFFLAGKPNMLVLEPLAEDAQSENKKKFNLYFPEVPDMPQDKSHYVIVSKETNIPLKVRVSMDVGNFYFVRSEN